MNVCSVIPHLAPTRVGEGTWLRGHLLLLKGFCYLTVGWKWASATCVEASGVTLLGECGMRLPCSLLAAAPLLLLPLPPPLLSSAGPPPLLLLPLPLPLSIAPCWAR